VANLSKMAAGHPLTDADRAPWLAAIGAWIDGAAASGRPAVVTCSALKRAYRDTLRAGRPQVRLIYLDADPAIVQARMVARTGHFFPPQLLASQLHDLQPPAPDEDALHVPIDASAGVVVEHLIAAEGLTAVEWSHDAAVERANETGADPAGG
jgi:gluconokinase